VRVAQFVKDDFDPPFALVLFMSSNLPLQGFRTGSTTMTED
jgi:hypothetical protein